MNIYICDDDSIFAQHLASLIKNYLTDAVITVFGSGTELMAQISCTAPDVVFLDIDMPQMDGFQAAQRICEENIIIIFVTSMENLVFQSFRYEPFWFLRKDHLDELLTITKKLKLRLDGEQQFFTFTSNAQTHTVPCVDIIYFESQGHYVRLCLLDREVRYKAKLKTIEEELFPLHFARIHIGYLVNLRYVQKIISDKLCLYNGAALPISRNRMKDTQQRFMQYMRSIR